MMINKQPSVGVDPRDDHDLMAMRPDFQELVFGFHGRQPDGTPDPNPYLLKQQTAESLWNLPASDRASFLKQVFPNLHTYIDEALFGIDYLPFRLTANHGVQFRIVGQDPLSTDEYLRLKIQRIHSLMDCTVDSRRDSIQGLVEKMATLPKYDNVTKLHWLVLAAALNQEGEESEQLLRELIQIIDYKHLTIKPTIHHYRAILASKNQAGWNFLAEVLGRDGQEEYVAKKLVQSLDTAHIDATILLLNVVMDKNFAHFSNVALILSNFLDLVWYDKEKPPITKDYLAKFLLCLSSVSDRETILESDDARSVYFAVYALACRNFNDAFKKCKELTKHSNPEHRFVGYYVVALGRASDRHEFISMGIDDDDIRIADFCIDNCRRSPMREQLPSRMKERFESYPKKVVYTSILFPTFEFPISKVELADTILGLVTDLNEAMVYLKAVAPYIRQEWLKRWGAADSPPKGYRELLLELSGDTHDHICSTVYPALATLQPPLTEQEIIHIEAHLKKKPQALRYAILQLLSIGDEEVILRRVERLLASKNTLIRLAGLKLATKCIDKERVLPLIENYRSTQAKHSEEEEEILAYFTPTKKVELTRENGFGLLSKRSIATQPAREEFHFVTTAMRESLLSLDQLVDELRGKKTVEHRGQKIGFYHYATDFPEPSGNLSPEDESDFFLSEIWEEWYRSRVAALRDEDGLELCRSLGYVGERYLHPDYEIPRVRAFALRDRLFDNTEAVRDLTLQHEGMVRIILKWLIALHERENYMAYRFDAAIQFAARLGQHDLAWFLENYGMDYRFENDLPYMRPYLVPARFEALSHEQKRELWKAIHYIQSTAHSVVENRILDIPPREILLSVWSEGIINDDELLEYFFIFSYNNQGGPHCDPMCLYSGDFDIVQDTERFLVLRKKVLNVLVKVKYFPGLIESKGGNFQNGVYNISGVDLLIALLEGLGTKWLGNAFWEYGAKPTREQLLSHLVWVSSPNETDTSNLDLAFQKLKLMKLPEQRFVELALFAPQWSGVVEHLLGWDGLENTIWCLYAHAKSTSNYYKCNNDQRRLEIHKRTSINEEEFEDGAIDVAWFKRCLKELGEQRMLAVKKATKFFDGRQPEKRTPLYIDAFLNKFDKDKLIEEVNTKRNRDRLTALSIIPIDESDRDADLLRRYETIQEFLRTSKKFGAQRRENDAIAVKYAMNNVACVAGYPDPLRLRWAMEVSSFKDLAGGSKTIDRDDVSVTLSINDLGEAGITVEKNGKRLKSVPATLKKDVEVRALVERGKDLKKQVSRVRKSLEDSMVRGDQLYGKEIRQLMGHPMLAPMLTTLLFVLEDGTIICIDKSGTQAHTVEGHASELDPKQTLRIAHPYDLFSSGNWAQWQRHCFALGYRQPFKQIFRELYVPTDAELDSKECKRFSTIKVEPGKSIAILAKRGWIYNREYAASIREWGGEFRNSAIEYDDAFITPSELNELNIPRVTFGNLPLKDVPSRIFSETLRDIDLVANVAYLGELDLPLNEETIAMRAAVIRETAESLNLKNIRIEKRFVHISGELANYRVHLGRGYVSLESTSSLAIDVQEDTSKLYLPFVDDDPVTLDVLSKTLLLAKDKDIKDFSLRQQIQRLK